MFALCCFFFFKQKTAYEMRISDWSSDVCSSDLGPRIVDLSADFRLTDPAVYAEWYGNAHPAPALLTEAVYGLTEYARGLLPTARIAACPGCYPTAALLALLPLVEGHAVDASTISVFAMSGVSGDRKSTRLNSSH